MREDKNIENKNPSLNAENEFVQFSEKYSSEDALHSGYLEIELKEKVKDIIYLSILNKSIADSPGFACITTDKDGIITELDKEAFKLLGYNDNELIGIMSILTLIKDEELVRYANILSELLGKKVIPEVDFLDKFYECFLGVPQELVLIKKNKYQIDVLFSLNYLKDSDGNHSGFIGIASDNSIRKEHGKLFKLQSAVFESLALAIIITDINGYIQLSNSAFTRLTGYSREEAIGKTPGEILKSGRQDKVFYENLWNTILDKKVWTGELINRKKDGTLYYEEQTITPMFDHKGKVNWFASVKIDISSRKELENNLIKSKEILLKNLKKEKELGEIKSRFVSVASHEFRTPLAAILLISDGLLSYWNRIPEDQIKDKLSKINNQTLHLTSIVNDLLQISKISDGNIELHQKKHDIIELCAKIVDSFNVNLKFKRIKFYSHFKLLVMNIDIRLITQVINNLLSNALKYSPENTTVIVSVEKETGELCISVSDNGIGIPESDQEKIFTGFFRGSNTGTIQGTGLGLNIAQESMHLHGGSITFLSNPRQGTRFTIHFPDELIIK
jgi:PAS domain S-box-containing protein